jgi:uncharacterized cupin superfamily protein
LRGILAVDKIKIEPISEEEVEKRCINSWDVWEKEPSEFDWAYINEEHCYIIEGHAKIETEEGTVEIKEGDYVVFPLGLNCKWKVLKRMRKYFTFK